jgi:hypothetical protein
MRVRLVMLKVPNAARMLKRVEGTREEAGRYRTPTPGVALLIR